MRNKLKKAVQYACLGSLLFILLLLSGCMHKIPEDPNTFTRTILFDGLNRSYRIHIPQSLLENSSPALVFVLHGGGGTAEGMNEP